MPGMTLEECEKNINCLVRIDPQKGKASHKGRGKIVGIDGKKVVVQPLGGHKKNENLDPAQIQLWLSKVHTNKQIRLERERSEDIKEEDIEKLFCGNNANNNDPWSNKKQSRRKKKTNPVITKPIVKKTSQKPPQETAELVFSYGEYTDKKETNKMNKKEWLRKNCGIVLDSLSNCTSEAYESKDKASVNLTDQLLQCLVNKNKFLALESQVLDSAILLIQAFAAEDVDEIITRADLEDLFEEKNILQRPKQIDPIAEIKTGKTNKKEVLEALIGPNGFKSASDLAMFVLKELKGKKAT